MVTAQETFRSTVIEPLKVNMSGKVLSYAEYLALPASQRSNDEADVVDSRFTQAMLHWLGFDSGEIIYNRPTPGHPQDKPDFVVKMFGSTAFVVEDKSTDEEFNEASVKQLRRYTVGTSGYCLWTNSRSIIALRYDANGQYQTLVEVRVGGIFGQSKTLFSQEANIEILHLLFHKERFTDISNLIQAIAVSENEWLAQAKSLTDDASLRTFISESRFVLDQLTTAIKARLSTVATDLQDAVNDIVFAQQRYTSIITNLLNRLKGGAAVNVAEVMKLEEMLQEQTARLSELEITHIDRFKPAMTSATLPLWNSSVQEINAVISTLRERELARGESRRIRGAYLVWLERYKYIEDDDKGNEAEIEQRRQQAFAEQVSYVFFVRLLLARVLEDKGLMPRLISDGGFKSWFNFLKSSSLDSMDEIRGESFLPLVYRRVASFYRHFFQQPVFDWFLPDDYLLALVLYRLNMYNFRDVTSDLLGFTYEAFIERTARNQKGHFLTPPTIVEFMLDRAGYDTSAIIGESLLDASCGSGSFLVHAARRLKSVLATAMAAQAPAERARLFIEQVKSKLVGLEINPFSCYLAELNLFIQVLDDLALLWSMGEHPDIERFSIYNTNSLEMPQSVLSSTLDHYVPETTFVEEATALDEAALVKSQYGSFGYVICNPPYLNRGIILGAKSYGDFPFYRDVVKGDENFYLLFLRLAAYYVAPGGTICFICPLNLFGDESTMRAREMFGKWRVPSITRFYARNVLFPGVLQGVCVVRFDNAPAQEHDMIEVRGGYSIDEAARTATQVQREQVLHNYPAKTTWNKPWLVNANSLAYDIWDFVRQHSSQDLADLLQNKVEVGKGDVRSTWSKPLLVPNPSSKTLPLTKGKNVDDWGRWSTVAYLSPSVSIPASTKDYTGSRWVQKQVQRIASLTQTETVIFLKEVSGLEMKRPIRGTIVQRDGQHPVAADETLLVMYTLDEAYTNLAYAVFGLLTSLPFNFFFSLFSTNAHANFKEILRLPMPLWSLERETQLADTTRRVLDAYTALYAHEQQYGTDLQRRIDANTVLTASRLPTLRLEELVLRGEVVLTGTASYSLDVLWNRGQLALNSSLAPDVAQAIEAVIRVNGTLSYTKGGKDICMPHPRVASAFLQEMRRAGMEREATIQSTKSTQQALDELVVEAYGITQPAWKDLIEKGVPWAR